MAYAKVKNNTLVQYPYTRNDLYKEYPNIKRAPIIPASQLPEGIIVVLGETPSEHDPVRQKLIYNKTPTLVNGKWLVLVSVVDKTESEFTVYLEKQKAGIRLQRDFLLEETDWWENEDSEGSPITAEQTAYRQALRNITDQEGFPLEVTWPTKP